MGIFGRRPVEDPPHPRREPRLEGPLTPERLGEVFRDCVDYNRRSIAVGGNEAMRCELVFLAGMVRMERVSDYVLRPLAQDEALGKLGAAVATGVVTLTLIVSGINRAESAADVTAQGLLIMKIAMMVLPLAAIAMGYFVYLRKYRIDEKFYRQIVTHLKERGDIK